MWIGGYSTNIRIFMQDRVVLLNIREIYGLDKCIVPIVCHVIM